VGIPEALLALAQLSPSRGHVAAAEVEAGVEAEVEREDLLRRQESGAPTTSWYLVVVPIVSAAAWSSTGALSVLLDR